MTVQLNLGLKSLRIFGGVLEVLWASSIMIGHLKLGLRCFGGVVSLYNYDSSVKFGH